MNKEKRLLRITWNRNRWELPSGHKWSEKKQGNTNVAYENQYGFGGEEWLFNPRYNIAGYQYGYIRGLWEVTSTDTIDEAYLFSIDSETKDRYLIAKLRNIELFDNDTLPVIVKKSFINSKFEMLEELKEVNADITHFDPKEFLPFVRFKMEDADIFDVPVLVNELKKDSRYNRFKPYIIDDELQDLLNSKIVVKPFTFLPGKRKSDNSTYIKSTTDKSITVKGKHAQIVNDLENYLKPEFSISKNNISVEKTVFGDNIADVVTLNNDNSYSIYEVKTSNNTRYNIRDSIGQLLDYSLWHENIKIKQIVIVAPSIITKLHISYLKRLKANLKLTIKYLLYNYSINEKFEEVEI